jgi:hypothetical protein
MQLNSLPLLQVPPIQNKDCHNGDGRRGKSSLGGVCILDSLISLHYHMYILTDDV